MVRMSAWKRGWRKEEREGQDERREVPGERVSRAHPEEEAARGAWRQKVRADHTPHPLPGDAHPACVKDFPSLSPFLPVHFQWEKTGIYVYFMEL